MLTSWSPLYRLGNVNDSVRKMHLTSGKAPSVAVGFGECSSLRREALLKVRVQSAAQISQFLRLGVELMAFLSGIRI